MKFLFVSNTKRVDAPLQDPATRYRCFHRIWDLRSLGVDAEFGIQSKLQRNSIDQADVIIFHRPSFDKAFERVIQQIKKRGKLAIADFDDLIFDPDLAEFSPAYRCGRASLQWVRQRHTEYLKALHHFEQVIVSTAPLKDALLSCHPSAKVTIIRNGLSQDWLEKPIQVKSENNENSYVIAYFSGTPSHDKDFEACSNVLSEISHEPKDIKLNIYGPLNFDQAPFRNNSLQHYAHVPYMELPDLIRSADVCLAPLEENPFNACKSGLKFFESALYGVPLVASPLEDLQRFSHEGLLITRDANEWKEKILHALDLSEKGTFRKDLAEYVRKVSPSSIQTEYFLELVRVQGFELKKTEHSASLLVKTSGAASSEAGLVLTENHRWDLFKRRFRKFKRDPEVFFLDSKYFLLRMIGKILRQKRRLGNRVNESLRKFENIYLIKRLVLVFWKIFWKWQPYSVLPRESIERVSKADYFWRVYDSDSLFELKPKSGIYPEGWIRFKYKARFLTTTNKTDVTLFVDTGAGLEEGLQKTFRVRSRDKVEMLIHVPSRVKGIYIRPMDKLGLLDIETIRLGKASKIVVALRLLAHPSAWPDQLPIKVPADSQAFNGTKAALHAEQITTNNLIFWSISKGLDKAYFNLVARWYDSEKKRKYAAKFEKRADSLAIKGNYAKAIRLYKKSLELNSDNYHCLMHLGNVYLKSGQFKRAIEAYRHSITLNKEIFWAHHNLAIALEKLGQYDAALSAVRESLKVRPGNVYSSKSQSRILSKIWKQTEAKCRKLFSRGERDQAETQLEGAVEFIRGSLPSVGNIPTQDISEIERVMIIYDPFLPQCVRYRVDQKISQLELLDIDYIKVPWNKVEKDISDIHFVDLVFFFRVPAFPQIVEIIEYAKAIGKIVVYEIDDLVFESAEYPEPIDSYGGLVSDKDYVGLLVSCVLFRKAISLCDYAIASTELLNSYIAKYVSKGVAFTHRNGLDSYSEKLAFQRHSSTIDRINIFYGSGTKAHNADFVNLLTPGLERLFQENEKIHLTVVGYLTLPPELLRFRERITVIGYLSNVEAYQRILGAADINLAVLNINPVNNCKSELKWFEAGILGIPSVVSSTTNYLDVTKPEENVLIARDAEEWYVQIKRLVEDPELRKTFGDKAQKEVLNAYSTKALAHNLNNIFTELVRFHNQTAEPLLSRKKILIVNVFFPPQAIGGATRVVRDNVEDLLRRYRDRYLIEILTTDHDNHEPYEIQQYEAMGVKVTRVSTPHKPGMDWTYKDPKMYEVFSNYLKYSQPDLIHFHCVQRLTGSVLEAAEDLNIPFLVTVHDAWWISDHQFLVDENGIPCDIRQSDPAIAAITSKDLSATLARQGYLHNRLASAKYVLAVSESFAEIYRQNGISNVVVNKNGLRQTYKNIEKTPGAGKIRIAHIGGMSEHKGYHLLEKAIKEGDYKNLELTVVDHSKEYGYLKTDMWNGTHVTLIGRVPQEKIQELYAQIDVLVAPSIWPESYGLVTREAQSAGVWVVASRRGAIGEDVIEGRNGFLVDVDDHHELQNVLTLIDRESEKYSQPHNLREVRSISEQADELVEIFDKSVSHSS